MRKIIVTAGVAMGLVISTFSIYDLSREAETWGLPSWIWALISILILIFVLLYVIYFQWRENKKLKEKEGLDFSPYRKDLRTLEKFLDGYDVIHAVFPVGDSIKIHNIYDSTRFKSVILFNPDGTHINTIPDGYYMKTAGVIRKDVSEVIAHIKSHEKSRDIDVRLWDGCMPFSMFIGNPLSGKGGILLETHVPYIEGKDRFSFIFEQSMYPDLFQKLLDSYQQLFKNSSKADSK